MWACQFAESPRRPKHRWEDNIKMDLIEIRLEGVDSIHLAKDRAAGGLS
jgi:hypothetical protein